MVDTGAMVSYVRQDLAASTFASAERVKTKETTMDVNGKKQTADNGIKVDLKIGKQAFGGLVLLPKTYQHIEQACGTNIDIVLGLDVIRSFNWGFDYKNSKWGISAIDGFR